MCAHTHVVLTCEVSCLVSIIRQIKYWTPGRKWSSQGENSLLKRRPWPQFVFLEWKCWRQACFWVGWPCSQWWGSWGSKWRCMPSQKYKVMGIPAMTLNKNFMTFALRYFSKRNTSHKVWENPMWWFQSHMKILQSLLSSYTGLKDPLTAYKYKSDFVILLVECCFWLQGEV